MTLSKSKIKDISKKENDFKYKKIKHNVEAIICEHCNYEEREDSLKNIIKEMNDNDTTMSKGVPKAFKVLKVIRGKYDDVIGWVIEWQ